MTQFESCLLDNDLSVLGSGEPEQLQQAWLNIYSEYLTLVNKGKNETHIQQLGKIHALSARITIVKLLANGLINTGFHAYFEALEMHGFKLDKIEDVQKVISAIKADEMELTMLTKNLPKEDKGNKIDRDYFTKVICEMEAMQGFGLDKDTLTVAKFAVYYAKMISKIEQSKTVKHGGRFNK